MLQRLPVRLLGAILNDVPAGGAYRYYSYYLPGYEAADEDSGSRRGPVLVGEDGGVGPSLKGPRPQNGRGAGRGRGVNFGGAVTFKKKKKDKVLRIESRG